MSILRERLGVNDKGDKDTLHHGFDPLRTKPVPSIPHSSRGVSIVIL